MQSEATQQDGWAACEGHEGVCILLHDLVSNQNDVMKSVEAN